MLYGEIKFMDAIVIDSESIYIISIYKNASKEDVLSAYMKVSGNGWYNSERQSYSYWTTLHSHQLYSIRRKIDKPERRGLSVLRVEVDVAHWWAAAYPIIENIATVTGAVLGVSAIASGTFKFIRNIRDKYKATNTKDEYKWIKDILSEDSWNVSILSEKLSFAENNTKDLLKGFGYTWDSHKMLYIATEHTKELQNIQPNLIF